MHKLCTLVCCINQESKTFIWASFLLITVIYGYSVYPIFLEYLRAPRVVHPGQREAPGEAGLFGKQACGEGGQLLLFLLGDEDGSPRDRGP